MKEVTAYALEENGGKIYEDYSGRYMYGEKTYAVVFDDFKEFFKSCIDVVLSLENYKDEEKEDIIVDLKALRSDSMGRGIVVY